MSTIKILFTGVGGQGIITSGVVLGEAAILENKNAVMSEVHGLAQRGGMVNVEMKIGDAKSPLIEEGASDIVVGMEPSETYRLRKRYNRNSSIIINTNPIVPFTTSIGLGSYPDVNNLLNSFKKVYNRLYLIDPDLLARKAGNPVTASIVFVGAVSGLKEMETTIRKEAVIKAIENHFPSKLLDINLKAFYLGYEITRNRDNNVV